MKDACVIAFVQSLVAMRLPSDILVAEDGLVRIMSAKLDKPVNLMFKPMPLSVGVFNGGNDLLVDPCAEEEAVIDGYLTIVVDEHSGKCVSISKIGGSAVPVAKLCDLLDICRERHVRIANKV